MEEIKKLPVYIEPNIKILMCQAMMNDMDSYDHEELKNIAALLVMLTRSGSYAFFTTAQVMTITAAMNNHEYFRRFVLNLYETTNVLREAFEVENTGIETWEKPFIAAIERCRQQYDNPKASILLDSVCEWAQLDDGVQTLLKHNKWMLTLYLACFTGAATQVIEDYHEYSGFMEKTEAGK